jgi:hypothetical protein
VLSRFSGLYLYPNGLNPGFLEIAFSAPLTGITFSFATADFHQVETPTTIQLKAFLDSPDTLAIGTATAHGRYGSDTMPMGSLSFTSTASFNLVQIGILPGQPAGSSDVLVDNLVVSPAVAPADVPEPGTYVLSGLTLLLLARRRWPAWR